MSPAPKPVPDSRFAETVTQIDTLVNRLVEAVTQTENTFEPVTRRPNVPRDDTAKEDPSNCPFDRFIDSLDRVLTHQVDRLEDLCSRSAV